MPPSFRSTKNVDIKAIQSIRILLEHIWFNMMSIDHCRGGCTKAEQRLPEFIQAYDKKVIESLYIVKEKYYENQYYQTANFQISCLNYFLKKK